jgi:hypothetical protein
MAIIGEIIKKVVELADRHLGNSNPVEAQKEVLEELLSKAEDTSFGKYYDFKRMLSQEDLQATFQATIPYHNYDKIYAEWWHKVYHGQKDITWPGKPDFFAVSSGTTSKKKHIPVTDAMLKSIRAAGIQQIKGAADFNLPAEFFEKEILMFGSSTNLKEVNGHLEGEISGISARQIPFWFEGYYRPGNAISSIDDWDKRVEALAREAPHWDIGSISGIPSWIELMMKKVIAYHQANTIHDIWPNFQVFTSGGVAFEPYKKSFDRLCSRPITVIDTYLTSEGYLATQTRKDTDAMSLITDNSIFFEFVPFKEQYINEDGSLKQDAPAITLNQVEEDVNYVLVISTVSGAWRYVIGDTIIFTDKEKAEIKITGRTKHYLNVVGSQLSVIHMNKAITRLEELFECNIKEFTVAALKEKDEYLHRWYLGIDDEVKAGDKEFAHQLDAILKEHNKNYAVARTKALKSVEVHRIPSVLFQQWTEKTNQKGGQVKVPRVMQAQPFRKWESFISQQMKG